VLDSFSASLNYTIEKLGRRNESMRGVTPHGKTFYQQFSSYRQIAQFYRKDLEPVGKYPSCHTNFDDKFLLAPQQVLLSRLPC